MASTQVDRWKEEACRGYERLCHDRDSILPHLRNDPSIRTPYTVTQITESALRREIRRIHTISKQNTSRIYDTGLVLGRADEGSWVVRWLLWNAMKTGGNRDVDYQKDKPLECSLVEDCQQTSPTPPKQFPRNGAQDPNRGGLRRFSCILNGFLEILYANP